MNLYRLQFHLQGPYVTPFLADTLYGHLCWAAIKNHGQAALNEILDSIRSGQPKFVLSDGFPGDLLPMPVLPPAPVPQGSLAIQRSNFLQEKKRRKTRWVTRDDFCRILLGDYTSAQDLSADDKKQLPLTRGTLKNTIDRNTGTTPAKGEGGLYELQETFQPTVTVYANVADNYIDTFTTLLNYLKGTGFGKRKSTGYGSFKSIGAPDKMNDDFFDSLSAANAFISLSTFVPGKADPIDGYWQLLVKYGKLGEEFALSSTPFKKPLLMFKAGAVFRLNGKPLGEYYGRIVDNISYLEDGKACIVQCCLALPVPMKLP